MKFLAATLCLLSLPASAVQVTLEWDASPAVEEVTAYRLYALQMRTAEFLVCVAAPTTLATSNFSVGPHTVYVTAGKNNLESAPSNYVTFLIFPDGNVVLAILQTSTNLLTWLTATPQDAILPRRFWRTTLSNP